MATQPTVYIETSIPSFYFETRTSALAQAWRLSTRAWWDRYRTGYRLVTSEVTDRELAEAPAPKAAAMISLVERIDRLPLEEAALNVAATYIQHKLFPQTAVADALHVAIASVHAIDFLLTWNVRHLANANKRRHLAVINHRMKLPTPTITTPELLIPEET